MAQLTPLGDWVLVRLEAEEVEPVAGEIVVPGTPRGLLERAVVEKCGPGSVDENARRKQLEVQQGQIVLMLPGAGYPVPGVRGKGERLLVGADAIVATV